MIDFSNIDDYEFEQLCAEILSKILKTQFRTFAKGPDKGIDIRKTNGDDKIIGQAKNVRSVSGVFASELNKIKKTGCKKYYLFIGCALSADHTTKIFNEFKDYMDDESFIFDANTLDKLLSTSEYKEILSNHFKLWAVNKQAIELLKSNDISIDTDTLKSRIQKHSCFYVDTRDYKNALLELLSNRIILLEGNAGVGKSTISEMIVLSLMSKFDKYNVIYSSSSDVDKVKNALSMDPEITNIIYIDDFLGSFYSNLTLGGTNSICSLVNFVLSHCNNFLILNTRGVILKEANRKYIDFEKTINSLKIKKVKIDNISKFDKARILFNHIVSSDLTDKVKNEIVTKKFYNQIINHKNYNPRSIEYICSNKNFENSGFLNYTDFSINALDNQEKTWEHAYLNNLSDVDRVFLLVLYSLTFETESISLSILEKAFNNEIKNGYSIDTTVDNFEISYKRLLESFITKIIIGDDNYIAFANPSVKECISKHEFINKNSFIYGDQYFAKKDFLKSKEFEKLIEDGTFSKLDYVRMDYSLVLALYLIENSHNDPKYNTFLLSALNRDYSKNNSIYAGHRNSDIFRALFYLPIFDNLDFNQIDNKFLDSFVLSCIKFIDDRYIEDIFDKIEDISSLLNDNDDVKSEIINLVEDSVYVDDIIERNIEYFDDETEFNEDAANDELVDAIDDELNQNNLYSLLRNSYDFEIDSNDIDNFKNTDVYDEYRFRTNDWVSSSHTVIDDNNDDKEYETMFLSLV